MENSRSKDGWKETELDPLSLNLDVRNSRLDLPMDASQQDIRGKLLVEGDVIQLAKGIIDKKGLLEGEKIIVCIESGNIVVLEGNRRVCAIQLLLKPTLLPRDYRAAFPSLNGASELLKNVQTVKAYIAPSRESAEPIITSRHTDYGIKKWSRLAQMRRAFRRFANGATVEDISAEFGADINKIEADIRNYRLYERMLACKGLTDEDLFVLKDNQLEITKLTRFVNSKDGTDALKLSYDPRTLIPRSALEQKTFDEALKFVARAFLVNQILKKEPSFNTRTPNEEVKEGIELTIAKFQGTPEIRMGKDDKSKKEHKKDRFFESLRCYVKDDHLSEITREIRLVNYRKFPIAATMLLRALLEKTFVFQMKKRKVYEQFIRKYGAQVKLANILKYCKGSGDKIFQEKSALKVLDLMSSAPKDYMNLVVHGNWLHANADTLVSYADIVRELVSKILSDENV